MKVTESEYHMLSHELLGTWATWNKKPVLIVAFSLGATMACCLVGLRGGVLSPGNPELMWIPSKDLVIR